VNVTVNNKKSPFKYTVYVHMHTGVQPVCTYMHHTGKYADRKENSLRLTCQNVNALHTEYVTNVDIHICQYSMSFCTHMYVWMCPHTHTHTYTHTSVECSMQPDNCRPLSMDLFYLGVYWISLLPLLRKGIETNSDINAETDALMVSAV